jgi:hypothetical protein
MPLLEGRVESLCEAAAVLSGLRDLSIPAFAATFRDPRDALAAPLLTSNGPTLHDVAETDYPSRLAGATALLRRRGDGVLVQVRPLPANAATARDSGAAAVRLCVMGAPAAGESREEALSRLAGAVLAKDAAVLLVAEATLADVGAAVASVDAACASEWLLLAPRGVGVTPALAGILAMLDGVEEEVVAVQPALALAPGHRLSGVWRHEALLALVRMRALRTAAIVGSGRPASLHDAIRAIVRGAGGPRCLRLPPSATPALWCERMARTSDAGLLRLATPRPDARAAGAALIRRIVLEAMARTGEPARAIAEALPATLERLHERAGDAALPQTGLEAAIDLASGGTPLRPLLEDCEGRAGAGEAADAGDIRAGLMFRPDLAWDQDDYIASNPDLALRRLRGEAIGPIDHLLDEGAIEGRPIRRRQIALISFADDKDARARLAAALDAARRGAARQGLPAKPAMAPPAPAPRAQMTALQAQGRLAAAAALLPGLLPGHGDAMRVADWPLLARLGWAPALRAAIRLDVAARDGSTCDGSVLAAFPLNGATLPALFESVLPPPGVRAARAAESDDESADALVAQLFARAPEVAGLPAVDHALAAGDYDLAESRLRHLRERGLIPVAAALARLRALCDWRPLIALAEAHSTVAEQDIETLFYARLYAGDADGAVAGIERAALRTGQKLMFRALAAYLTARFEEAHALFTAASAAGGGPDHYPLLMWQHLERGETDKADAVFAMVCLIDRDFRRSMLDIARYFDKTGDPATGARVLQLDLASDRASEWLRQPKLYYLARMLLKLGRTDEAQLAIAAFQANGSAGSRFSEAPRQQLRVSLRGFAPGLTALPPRAADEGIATVLGWMAQDKAATFVFGGFQSGDCYLFLYAWSARPRREARTVLVVPQRLADLAALFADGFDAVRVAEIACFHTLRNSLAGAGLLDRAVIGHLDFLTLDADGAVRPAQRLPGHYLLMVKQALGLPLDGSGRHPAPAWPSPMPRTSQRRALIVPMAQSLLPLSAAIWNQVAGRLIDAGFEVLINRGPHDPSLHTGATEVGFDRRGMLALAHDCDLIIGLRSGLIDILSGSPARLVEIYNSHIGAGGFLYAWELAALRQGRETQVVRLVEGQTSDAEAAERILAAALGA